MRQWTDKHGEDGLRAKFVVFKPRDGYHSTFYGGIERGHEPGVTFPAAAEIGADGEFVFVLRPETDEAAYHSLLEYARAVQDRAPRLAADIRSRLRQIHCSQATEPERQAQGASELLTECHGCNGAPCPGRCPWL